MPIRTRADYENIIKLAYKGYTAEGIEDLVGRSAANVSHMMSETRTKFKDIRAAKRQGLSLDAFLSEIDWRFLDEKAARKARSIESGKKNFAKHHQQNKKKENPAVAADIAQMKTMLTEIYEALTSAKCRLTKAALYSRIVRSNSHDQQ